MSRLDAEGMDAREGIDDGAWRRARRRAGVVARPERARPPGVPALCPDLGDLLGVPRDSVPHPTLLAAALSVGADVRVLRSGQFRLLYLAWVQERSLAGIGRLIDVESVAAVRQRLLRVSNAIERHIATEVAKMTDDRPGTCGGGTRRAAGTHPDSARADLLRALELLAHR